MFFVDPAAVEGAAAAETLGATVTTSSLTGLSPALLDPVPMGADEDTIAYAMVVAAHGGAFLAPTMLAAAQRGLYGASVGVTGIETVAMDATNAIGLTA